MAKRVRISDNGGTNWYTLPGNTAELSNEAGELDDTVFGQEFSSKQTGLISWSLSANSMYKGFAGYVAKILKIGASTGMVDEAMSLVSGKTYKIDAATKNVWNRFIPVVIKDAGAAVDAADILSIDYLFGRVTFATGYSVTGPVTVSGSYFPLAEVGCANEYTLTQTAETQDTTCMSVAQANNGVRTYDYGLKTVSLELKGVYRAGNAYLSLLQSRSELIIEVNPDGAGKTVARGFFKPKSTSQSGNVGALEEENVSFGLAVPDDDLIPYPFHWVIDATSTLNMAVQKCLNAWEAKTLIDVAYLPDGVSGVQGEAVITDMTLKGGLGSMNEFTVKLQGSDELTAYP